MYLGPCSPLGSVPQPRGFPCIPAFGYPSCANEPTLKFFSCSLSQVGINVE